MSTPATTTPGMSNPTLDDDVNLTVRIFLPTQLNNDTKRPLKRKFDDTSDVEFVLICKRNDELASVWKRAEENFKGNYGREYTSSGYFSRMRIARGADVFMYYKVGSLFKPGEDNVELHIILDPMGRMDSLPPHTTLRPEGFQPPTPDDHPFLPESGVAKRRKVHGGESMPLDDISPEMPIESHEPGGEAAQRQQEEDDATEGKQRHHENQATEPRVDADGYRVPPIPPNRPILPAKSRRTAQTANAATAQTTVSVQDSQANATTPKSKPKPKPRPTLEALWLRKEAATGRQQSMPINHSSPAEAAATRTKTAVPQPLQLNQATSISSTFAQEAGIESTSGETLPTPTSGGQLSADQEAPTSAQPPPSFDGPPFSNMAHRFLNQRAMEDDEIIDDFDANDFDDNILREVDNGDDEDDDDYIPDEPVKPRGRTRSRSLETITPAPNASEGQLPEDSSTTPMVDGTAEDVPTSTNAFETMRSSQAARSSSARRDTGSAAKWSRREDIALLKGIKANLNVPNMKKMFSIDRSESAIRNRKATLLKMFPGGKVPSTHEFYAEVEGNASTIAATPAAVALTLVPSTTSTAALPTSTTAQPATTTTPLPTAPTNTLAHRQQWSPDQKQILWKAVAHGFTAKEIRQKHFPNRSEESVIKKVNDVLDRVVAREKKTGTFPDDSVPIKLWKDQDSLKMRRAVKEGLTWHEACDKYFSGFPMDSIRKKFAAYKAQLRKAKSPDSPQDDDVPIDDDHSPDEEEANVVVETAPPTEEAQGPNQPTAQRHPQQRASPQVVIPQQTQLPFKRDKQKGTVGPSGAAVREQLNRQYGRRPAAPAAGNNSSSTPAVAVENSVAALVVGGDENSNAASNVADENDSSKPVVAEENSSSTPVAAEENDISAPVVAEEDGSSGPVVNSTDDVEVIDLRDADSDDEFVDVDDIIPDDDENSSSAPVATEENGSSRPATTEEDSSDSPMPDVVDENSNSTPLISEENGRSTPVAEENYSSTPFVTPKTSLVPATTEETVGVVTAPYDLRTWLSEPNDKGCVMVGRPEFPCSFQKDIIETDEQIWEKAMRLHKGRKGLAKTQFEIDWLGWQSYIALSARDYDEVQRVKKKLLPLQRFLRLKERGTVPRNTNFADWVPDRSAREGSVDEEFDRDDEDGEQIESDYYDEDDEGGYGAQLPDEEEYPHGVERDREIVEVEDEEEEGEDLRPAEPPRAVSNGVSTTTSDSGQRELPKRKRKSQGPKPEGEKKKRPRRKAKSESGTESRTDSEAPKPAEASHNGTTANNVQENATHGWTAVNQVQTAPEVPGGFFATVSGLIGRTFHIPDAPARRSPQSYVRPRMPYPSSEEDSDNSSSDDENGK